MNAPHTPEDDDHATLRQSLVGAARDVLCDEELMAAFWKSGYQELSLHVKTGASQWVGAKLLTLLGSTLVGLGLYLIVRFGGDR